MVELWCPQGFHRREMVELNARFPIERNLVLGVWRHRLSLDLILSEGLCVKQYFEVGMSIAIGALESHEKGLEFDPVGQGEPVKRCQDGNDRVIFPLPGIPVKSPALRRQSNGYASLGLAEIGWDKVWLCSCGGRTMYCRAVLCGRKTLNLTPRF